MTLNSLVKRNISFFMNCQGKSQDDMAALLHCDRSTISRQLNSNQLLTLDVVEKYCKALGVEYTDVFAELNEAWDFDACLTYKELGFSPETNCFKTKSTLNFLNDTIDSVIDYIVWSFLPADEAKLFICRYLDGTIKGIAYSPNCTGETWTLKEKQYKSKALIKSPLVNLYEAVQPTITGILLEVDVGEWACVHDQIPEEELVDIPFNFDDL